MPNFEQLIKGTPYFFPTTIEEIDDFTGTEFENFLFYYFKAKGYQAELTGNQGDKGIDLTVKMHDTIVGIQAKRWKSNVSPQEIRNMAVGKNHYHVDILWLITTSNVTRDANLEAKNMDITIFNRDFVTEILDELLEMKNINFRTNKIIQNKPIKEMKVEFKEEDQDIFKKLQKLRFEISKKEKIPTYMVFSNKTIIDLINKKPKNMNDLENVFGLGKIKIDKFGKNILDVLNDTF